jgi:hypothetical protein
MLERSHHALEPRFPRDPNHQRHPTAVR